MPVIYNTEEGGVAVCSLVSSVPEGVPYAEVDALPDSTYREAWMLQGGQVGLDLDKVADIDYEKAKRDRAVAVDAITVTTSLGNTYNGDEDSQNRMSRAITLGSAGMTLQWKLADNTVIAATWEDLKDALYLAGQAQTEAWMI